MPWLQGWSGGAWRTLADEAPRRAQPRDDEWWRQFDDPVLDHLVAEAQRLNPGVRTAGMRIMEARAQLGIAGSALYPQLQQVNGRGLAHRQPRHRRPRHRRSGPRGLAFDLAWELDFWGKFKRGIESADAAYFASIAQYDDVQVLVAAQAASLYASIRTTELRLRIANENAAIQQRSLEITERLFRSGNDSELDVQQARSQYLGTLATIPEIESSLRQTRNALCVLLARPPDALPELQQRAREDPRSAARSDRRHAGRDAAAPARTCAPPRCSWPRSRRRSASARRRCIRRSRSSGSVGLSATTFGSPSATLSWGLGPALVWNVFDYGRLKNQVLVQDARFQQLYEQYQDVVLRAARELDDAATASPTPARRSTSCAMRCRPQGARSTSPPSSTAKGWSTSSACSIRSARCSAQQERLVASQGGVVQYLIAVYKAMGGGWQAGRSRPVLDDATQATMGERSDWKSLLQAPLPPPSAEFLPPSAASDTP